MNTKEEVMSKPPQSERSLTHQLALVTLERDMLKKELEDVKELRNTLLRVLEHRPLTEEDQGTPPPLVEPPVRRLASGTRLQILELLRRHPSGLHRSQIEKHVQIDPTRNLGRRKLGPTLNHMKRDGLITHLGSGVYVFPTTEATPPQA